MSMTVGANLTPLVGPLSRRLSRELSEFLRGFQLSCATKKTMYHTVDDQRIFTKAGAPVTNTAADSPGQDMCLVWDTTNEDLYLISAWSAATTFTATKILD